MDPVRAADPSGSNNYVIIFSLFSDDDVPLGRGEYKPYPLVRSKWKIVRTRGHFDNSRRLRVPQNLFFSSKAMVGTRSQTKRANLPSTTNNSITPSAKGKSLSRAPIQIAMLTLPIVPGTRKSQATRIPSAKRVVNHPGSEVCFVQEFSSS